MFFHYKLRLVIRGVLMILTLQFSDQGISLLVTLPGFCSALVHCLNADSMKVVTLALYFVGFSPG